MAKLRRLVNRVLHPIWVRTYAPLGRLARRLNARACFVAITGSFGKTTTKQLIAAVLSAQGSVHRSGLLTGRKMDMEKHLIFMRPWNRFCVEELSGHTPGALARATAVFQPEIGVVTRVSLDHHKNFQDIEDTAKEKSTLVRVLPPHGTAVLNADDPRVWAMRDLCKGRVIGCGFSEEADLRAEDVSAAWPERLSFTAVHDGQKYRVQTRMIGAHWVFSALAALGVGLARGIPLEEAGRMLEKAEPMYGRMSSHETKDGVTFLIDSFKSSYATFPAALEVLATAQARRKYFVLGHISDYKGSATPKYRDVVQQAMASADEVLLVTPANKSIQKKADAEGWNSVKTFDSLYELNNYLQPRLETGDLVLTKGAEKPDHLVRLYLDRELGVTCWRERCGRRLYCTDCKFWKVPFVPLPT